MEAIEGYDMMGHSYFISQSGNVYFQKPDGTYHQIKPRTQFTGNRIVKLYKDKGRSYTMRSIHMLVAKHFVPNPNNYKFVRHRDGDKTHNNYQNLEWYRSTCIHSPENKVATRQP